MTLFKAEIDLIKTVARDKPVTIYTEDGYTLSGVFYDAREDHVRIETDQDITFVSTSSITAIQIRK